jgi:demethylmenaquinone methyltransferase/2-methoxy-6-polyprenyl-1,4-benzoquinol methylase
MRQQAAADGFDFGQFWQSGPFRGFVWCDTAHRAIVRRAGRAYLAMKQRIGKRMSDKKQTHFGFQTVDEDAKAGMVHEVFSSVASRYDLMNDLMSAGVHRVWKNAMMDWLAPRDGQHLLDVAGGTGDVAFRFLDRAPGGRVTVCDMTESMLVEGRKRADAVEKGDRLAWVTGDAMALPFADNSFDRYTISFGIRNVTRIPDALAEAYRVLKPGGRLMVLEFSQIPVPAMQWAYDRYSFNVIPAMGQAVTGDRDSYQYLVESIRKFPDQDAFADMIRAAGFGRVQYRNLSMGIAALHSGWKL